MHLQHVPGRPQPLAEGDFVWEDEADCVGIMRRCAACGILTSWPWVTQGHPLHHLHEEAENPWPCSTKCLPPSETWRPARDQFLRRGGDPYKMNSDPYELDPEGSLGIDDDELMD